MRPPRRRSRGPRRRGPSRRAPSMGRNAAVSQPSRRGHRRPERSASSAPSGPPSRCTPTFGRSRPGACQGSATALTPKQPFGTDELASVRAGHARAGCWRPACPHGGRAFTTGVALPDGKPCKIAAAAFRQAVRDLAVLPLELPLRHCGFSANCPVPVLLPTPAPAWRHGRHAARRGRSARSLSGARRFGDPRRASHDWKNSLSSAVMSSRVEHRIGRKFGVNFVAPSASADHFLHDLHALPKLRPDLELEPVVTALLFQQRLPGVRQFPVPSG